MKLTYAREVRKPALQSTNTTVVVDQYVDSFGHDARDLVRANTKV